MMKRILIICGIAISIIILVIFGMRIYTKSFSPEASAVYSSDALDMEVDYCRPSKKGRDIFGGLLKYGEIWRTGANEATLISFSRNVTVNENPLKSGKYSLYTIPRPDEWTIIFNSQTGQWGTIYNEDRDVLRVDVPALKSNKTIEVFKISFENEKNYVNMILEWDDTLVKVPIKPS